MISCMISDHIKDLTVSSPEAVAFQIERVASCLGPSTVELTLPLNTTECTKLPFTPVAGNQVVLKDGVQLPCSLLHVSLWRYLQLLPKFSPIHAVSFVGSQRIIGWNLRNGYSSHPCPASWPSSSQTTSGCPGSAGSGDASASPGSGSVGRRGRFRPHHGGGRRRSGAVATPDLGDIATAGRA